MKSSIWLIIGVFTDLPVTEEVDGLGRKNLGAVGGSQEQGAAAAITGAAALRKPGEKSPAEAAPPNQWYAERLTSWARHNRCTYTKPDQHA